VLAWLGLALALQVQTPAQRASQLVDAGVALSNQGRFPEAAAKLVEALSLDPRLAEAHYLLGLIRQNDGRPDAAMESFRAALRINAAYGRAQARVCELATVAARGRESGYDAALAACRRASALEPADPEPHFHAGYLLGKLGNWGGAIQSFGAALRLDPKYPGAKYELGVAHVESRDLARGVALLREVVAAEPTNANARFQLGSALAKSGDCGAAVPHLESATEVAQKHYLLSGCYKKLGRAAEAEAAMARVKELREGAAARMQAKFRAAVAHQKAAAGQLDAAIAEYRAALELSNDPGIQVDLAVALLRKGDAGAVLALLASSTDPLARYQVALAQWKLARGGEARATLEAVVRDRPAFVEAWYQLGVVMLATGDVGGGERALATAVGLRPDDGAVRAAWAEALDKSGRPAEARAQRTLAGRR
jgi:tetratricopeptide (TPR) repeat protein